MRIFCYGCSITDYHWPTWADILCYEYQDKCEVHNYGNSGTGNTAIAQHVAATHLMHNLQDSDYLLTTWTSYNRCDKLIPRYGDRNTITYSKLGNVLNNPHFDEHYLSGYWSLEDDIIQGITARLSVDQFPGVHYNGNIGSSFAEAVEANEFADELTVNYLNAVNVNAFPHIYWDSKPHHRCIAQYDGHPTPQMHLDYLQSTVLPAIGDRLTVSDSTVQWVRQWEKWLARQLSTVRDQSEYNIVLEHSQDRRLEHLRNTHLWNSLFRVKDYMKGDNQLLRVGSTITENNTLDSTISSGINRLFTQYVRYLNGS